MTNTTIQLSNRVQSVKLSPTVAVSARAIKLQAEGKDIINLGVGEPDFDTPEHIKEAAYRAIKDGFTKYTVVDGIPSLKNAIIKKLANENRLNYQPNQITVSCGVKQAIFNLTQAVINPGDEVIIPAPYWVSYPDIVLLANGVPVTVTTTIDQHFKISPDQLEKAITPKTRLLILNSPSNPTGVAYSFKELAALAEVLLRHPQILIATDDMYEHILWTDAPFVNILNVCPDLYDRCAVLNGVSKAYAMTGWRIGYTAGPATLISAMTKVQSQSTSNPTSISQIAAQAALEGDQQCVRDMNKAYKERHDVIFAGLQALAGTQCIPSDGTFYSFPNIQKIIDRMPNMKTDLEFSDYLLNKAEVAVVPGSAFGAEGCIRISYATSMDKLKNALKRIKEAVE